MSLRNVASVVGLLLVFVGLSMGLALAVSLLYGDGDALALLGAAVLTAAAGTVAWRLGGIEGDLTAREGYAI
ncbi:MAG: TrkH family potassium uptake protein, partial [Gemmatimonadetes bacterium]|nr:TrkH family potassium uptake protein [Gemmatimonadota bacterium]